jgi:hypothetical protein
MKFILGLCFLGLTTQAWTVPVEKSIQLLRAPNGKKIQLDKQDVVSLDRLEGMFSMNARTPGLAAMIKHHSLKHKQKAVPVLIKVMKSSQYPDQNRWHATMLLAQIMGKKSAPFIAKFYEHPNWMMRLASLKALMGLGQKEYVGLHARALKDNSLIVRIQALDNISRMNMRALGSDVWNMLYDQTNYSGEAGTRKRTSIVKSVIRTLGDLKYEKAGRPMALLIQKPRYQDLIEDLDYSLEKITGEKSPNEVEQRRKFWSKLITKSDSRI